MKNPVFALLVLLPLGLVARDVQPGDSVATVLSELGVPRGRLQVGNRERLCFDRGEVEVRAGVVTRVALRSDEAQAAFEERSAANAERVRNERARLTEAGEALKARKLADATFRSAPLSYQVAFWEDFARKYSTVPCKEELTLARLHLAEQEEAIRTEAYEEQRVAELEARAAEDAREERERQVYFPVFTGHSHGYGRYYGEAGRQRQFDRDYYERVNCGPDASWPNREDRSHREKGTWARRHDRPQHNQTSLICRTGRSGPVQDNRSQVSSHTAMAFAGQNWLVWPSPSQAPR